MRDKITNKEKALKVLTRLRKRVKDPMFLFPSKSSTFELLERISRELKDHIKSIMKEDDDNE